MATNPKKTNKDDKFEGIITKDVLKQVLEQTTGDNQEATFHIIKVLEPVFYEEVVKAASDTKNFFRSHGVTGSNLDQVANVVVTFYLKGLLSHRNAISKIDAKKLDEMYNMDYDAYTDKLIDAKLAQIKKANKSKAKKPKIESIEPKRVDKGLEGLIDDGDLGDKR